MKKIGGFISAAIILIAFIIKCMFGTEYNAEISILFMIAFLILLIFEVIPVTLSCLISLGIMPVIGVAADFSSALTGFSNQVVFFILASFGLAMALTQVPLSKRLLRKMIRLFGKNTKRLVLAFMICTAMLSSVISNVPTCAVFLSVGLNLLELYPEDERKQTGKTMMIGIPIASMIGGVMTPAGSSINLLAISLMEKYTGTSITFVQWMCIGMPVAILLLPVSWLILVKIFAPAELNKENLYRFISNLDIPGQLSVEEKKVLGISGVMLCLWIFSSWFPGINVMVVAVLGCAAFCIPRFGVLSVDDFLKQVNWNAFFLVGTVLSMGNVLVENGVSEIIMSYLPNLSGTPGIIVLMYIAFITFILLVVVPVAPSLVTFLTPAIINIAFHAGVNPVLAISIFAICACNCYLFPLDTVCLLTYSKGYYKMTDMFKVSLPIQLTAIIIVSVIGSVIGGAYNWI